MSTNSDIAVMERGIQQLLLSINDKSKRKTISRRITTYLKTSYRSRIKSQVDINDKPFKHRAPIRSRAPYRLKQEKRKLLINFTKASYLRSRYSADQLRVGYTGRTGVSAKYQNEGAVQQRKHYFIKIPARTFTGISDSDWDEIEMIISEEL